MLSQLLGWAPGGLPGVGDTQLNRILSRVLAGGQRTKRWGLGGSKPCEMGRGVSATLEGSQEAASHTCPRL